MTSSVRRVYLDHNASMPMLPEARAALLASLDHPGNPSSVHAEGRKARGLIEDARRSVAALVGAPASNVVFTSGASEAASTCLTPHWIDQDRDIEVSRLAVVATDHPCLREGGRFGSEAVSRLAVDASGEVLADDLRAWLAALGGRPGMLALTLANGETGVLQPIDRIRDLIGAADVLLVIDAVQAAGRLPLDIGSLGADALILSGHKIGAAKGVGAYVTRSEGMRPAPLVIGGGQERRRRSGTEAVPLIASFGAAAAVAARRAGGAGGDLEALRDRLESGLQALDPALTILGSQAQRLPNTVAFAIPGVSAETAQMALDLQGFAVSSGSACSSGKVGPSHVVVAMAAAGLGVDPADGAIRASVGHETAAEEIDRFVAAVERVLERQRSKAGTRRAA